MFSAPNFWLGARGFFTQLIKEQPRAKLKQAGAKNDFLLGATLYQHPVSLLSF